MNTARLVVPTFVLAAATVFGGLDQYLGSLNPHWAVSVSLLSAPWLLLGFLAGWTKDTVRGAMLFGIAATYAAWVGYAIVTLSPVEGAHYSFSGIVRLMSTQALVLAGGLVTGAVFGWFGNQWRCRRSWLGAALTAATFCLEPLAVRLVDQKPLPLLVAAAEVVVGLLLFGYIGSRRGLASA